MSKTRKTVKAPVAPALPGTITLTSSISRKRINFLKSDIAMVYEDGQLTHVTMKGNNTGYPVIESFDHVQKLRINE